MESLKEEIMGKSIIKWDVSRATLNGQQKDDVGIIKDQKTPESPINTETVANIEGQKRSENTLKEEVNAEIQDQNPLENPLSTQDVAKNEGDPLNAEATATSFEDINPVENTSTFSDGQPRSSRCVRKYVRKIDIPQHWDNYRKIVNGAVDDALSHNSGLQDTSWEKLRDALNEFFQDKKTGYAAFDKNSEYFSVTTFYKTLHLARCNAIDVLGLLPTDSLLSITDKTTYEELKQQKIANSKEATPKSTEEISEDKKVTPKLNLPKAKRKRHKGTLAKTEAEGSSSNKQIKLEGIQNNERQMRTLESLSKYTMKDEFSDCELIVHDQFLFVNKTLLGIHSGFFRDVFNRNLGDKFKIVDVELDDFLQLLDFLYLQRHQVTVDTVEPLLQLADQFKVWSIKASCEFFLQCATTDLGLAKRLFLAQQYKLNDLKKDCISQCGTMEKFKAMTDEKEFKQIEDETLQLLLKNITQS